MQEKSIKFLFKKRFVPTCIMSFIYLCASGQPLSGSYTIGNGSSDFSTIHAALSRIEQFGISGSVIFNLLPGTYKETNEITQIFGDTSFRITFESSTGKSNDVIIQDSIADVNNALIKIDSYGIMNEREFIFRNISFNNLSKSYPMCLYASECSIELNHCNFKGLWYLEYSEFDETPSCLVKTIKLKNFNADSTTFSGTYYCLFYDGGNFNISHCHFLNNISCSIFNLHSFFHNRNFSLKYDTVDASTVFYKVDTIEMDNNVFNQEPVIEDSNKIARINKNIFNAGLSLQVSNFCSFVGNKSDSLVSLSSPSVLVQYDSINTLVVDASASLIQFSKGKNLIISGDHDKVLSCNYNCIADGVTLKNSNTLFKKDTLYYGENVLNLTGCQHDTVDSCYIEGSALVLYCYYMTITNNTFLNLLDVGFTHQVRIENNFLQVVEVGVCDTPVLFKNKIKNLAFNWNIGTSKIFNNYINDGLDFDYDNDSVLVYNNNIFMDPPTRDRYNNGVAYSYNIILRNNNLNKDLVIVYPPEGFFNSDYNNYYPTGGDTDSHSIHVDPQYLNNKKLVATNPILAGKGLDLDNEVSDDINGNKRLHPPTIGANELCMTASPNKSFTVQCGQNVTLNECLIDSNYQYSWFPSAGLNTSTIPNPILTAGNSQQYLCRITMNAQLIEVDTVNINVVPFELQKENDTLIQYCGYGLYLNPTWNPNATYHWTPTTGLSDSTIRSPFINPKNTTTYIVTASVPGCGTSSDTIKVSVDSLPVAFAYILTQNYNTISYLNASTCADSYLWLFGDGASDTSLNPTHTYTMTGEPLLTLIAYNSYGSDTFSGYVFIDSILTGVNQVPALKPSITIFPNPVSSLLKINFNNFQAANLQVEIVDNLGRKILFGKINVPSTNFISTFDVSKLSPGIYIMEFEKQDETVFRKFVKL